MPAEILTRPVPLQEATSPEQTVGPVRPKAPRFYMDNGVLFRWGTEQRKMSSSEDLGIFTGPHRVRKLLERYPEVTTIVQNRELVSRAEIFSGKQ